MTAGLAAPIVQEGWFEGLSLEAYLSIPAMSASGLEHLRRSPAHYRWECDHPSDPTDAMKQGTALHLSLLEADLFQGRYVSLGRCEGVKKDGAPCGYQGSVYRHGQSFCGTHDPEKGEPIEDGVEVMPAEALDRIEGMRLAVHNHPDAREFFRGVGASEVTGIWRDEKTGVLCKIRLDREVKRAAIQVDVKSTRSASEDFFPRDAANRGYHRKAAWYRRGLEALGKPAIASALIAVESQPPHGCQMFLIDEGDLEKAAAGFDRLLVRYADCLDANTWPSYDIGFRHMTIPPWHLDAPATDNDFDTEEAAA